MQIPLKVTFRNMEPSPAIEANIEEKASKLSVFYDGIMSCRVIVEAPHRHRHKGKPYGVRIDLTMAGRELIVNRDLKRLKRAKLLSPELADEMVEDHEPSKHGAREDAYVAIRDAFSAAGRKLQDYVRRRRGKVKSHEPAPHGRVSKLFPGEDYGFLETGDRREIYFHKNIVLAPGYDRLEVGGKVQFADEMGEKGPQATSVRIITGETAGQ